MRHVYLAATGQNRGKTTVSLGVMDGFRRRAETSIALKRAGQAEEIVAAALYLASDHASYTTGALLRIDGGSH